jgi:hypothetical protein
MTNEELMNMMTDMGLHEGGMENWVMDNAWVEVAKRVAAHVKKPWVGLTKEEAKEISLANRPYVIDMIAALEARLKEKNT